MEYTLDEKVDQRVGEYLREHHTEYRNAKQSMKELMQQHQNVQDIFLRKYACKIEEKIMNPEEGTTDCLLDFFIKTRTDELEKN